MVGQPAPREWPCQICNLPGRTVAQRGDACEQCRKDAATWDDPGVPSPTVHEILPPRYRDGRHGGRKDDSHGLEASPPDLRTAA